MTLLLTAFILIPSSVTSFAAESNCVIQMENGVTQRRFNNVTAYYNSMPDNVREYVKNAGWSYEIVSGNLGARYGYKSILGITIPDEKIVYIDNRDKAETSIIHETGHIIDYSLNWASNGDAFESIFQFEHNNLPKFMNTHKNNYNTSVEYFAESFRAYVQYPALLEKYCPDTYNFMDVLVTNL